MGGVAPHLEREKSDRRARAQDSTAQRSETSGGTVSTHLGVVGEKQGGMRITPGGRGVAGGSTDNILSFGLHGSHASAP